MPELPEVYFSTHRLTQLITNSTITNIQPLEQGGGPRQGLFDELVLGSDALLNSPALVKQHLLNKKVIGLGRFGKYSWFTLNCQQSIVFHLGMSGWIEIKGVQNSLHLDSNHSSNTWPPKFTKLLITFSNSVEIAFTDPRRLGRISLKQNPLAELSADLAPDPLTYMPSHDAFIKRLEALPTSGGGPIKSMLLDQRALVCGIGNYLADEILLVAKIHPETPARALLSATLKGDDDVAERLRTAIATIVKTCCDCLVNGIDFPESYLFHSRWGKSVGETKIKKSHHSPGPISQITVGGRTTLFVSTVQKKYSLQKAITSGGGSSRKRVTVAAVAAAVSVVTSAATTTTSPPKKRRVTKT